ncbi:MAG: hypothetical protein ISR48_02620 [Alphaproteobacteria bacterium]|nr:hypothetical protein [Alphaproteobacteria bacterium]
MKRPKRSFEIFNISFLDVVSCGFGAVVLLVLLYKPPEAAAPSEQEDSQALLRKVIAAETKITELTQQLEAEKKRLDQEQALRAELTEQVEQSDQTSEQSADKKQKLESDIVGLELVQSSLKRASISQNTAVKRDEEVGGIPVDSDYVIFIVDTSGSMKDIWSRVMAEFIKVLDIHPKVKGFQVLNDNGTHLISGYAGKWIPDTPQRRKRISGVFKNWNSASNSSPVEGLTVALRKYANPNISLSIYVFGDDYTGSSYDSVIQTLRGLNTNKRTGKRLAKIHGIGFSSRYSTNRFPILMREVAKRNGGTFLALPR